MRLLIFVPFLFTILVSEAQTNAHWSTEETSSSFHIGQKSELKLKGKTNVNSFDCACENDFPASIFQIIKDDSRPNSFLFSNTYLDIAISALDCGNALMNKDLRKALNAENFPHIRIELVRVEYDRCQNFGKNANWIKMKVLTKISLNGNHRESWIDITAKKMDNDLYRFIGTKKLLMTDFCVVPPTALMGMVKVEDEISIGFDLEIMIDENVNQ